MRRINVIGTTGSGKSHFSRALAKRLGVDYIQLDQLHWKPAWVESTTEEFLGKLASKVAASSWVIDGSYSKANVLKWRYADTIIWLDYSFVRTFYQLFCRTIERIRTRQEVWPGTGNIETWRGTFGTSDSILVWCLRTYAKNRRAYRALQLSHQYRHIRMVRLRSPREASEFLAGVRVGD